MYTDSVTVKSEAGEFLPWSRRKFRQFVNCRLTQSICKRAINMQMPGLFINGLNPQAPELYIGSAQDINQSEKPSFEPCRKRLEVVV